MNYNIIKYIKKLNKKPSVQRRLLEHFIAQGASHTGNVEGNWSEPSNCDSRPQRTD